MVHVLVGIVSRYSGSYNQIVCRSTGRRSTGPLIMIFLNFEYFFQCSQFVVYLFSLYRDHREKVDKSGEKRLPSLILTKNVYLLAYNVHLGGV